MKNDSVYLRHVLDAIEKIVEYTNGFTYETFLGDSKTIDATLRELEIIGEAANSLSDDFKLSHPEIPFRNMIDMRNVLIHEYFGVNVKTVWNTCKDDLPPLKRQITSVLLA